MLQKILRDAMVSAVVAIGTIASLALPLSIAYVFYALARYILTH